MMAKRLQFLSSTGRGGLRRPLLIGTALVGAIGTVILFSSLHHTIPSGSHDAKTASMNALPGGPQTDPQQESLARQTAEENAARAARSGSSFTPPLSPSRPAGSLEVGDNPAASPSAVSSGSHDVHTVPVPDRRPIPVDERFAAPAAGASRNGPDPKLTKLYDEAAARLISQWGSRAPATELALDTTAAAAKGGAEEANRPSVATSHSQDLASSIAARAAGSDSSIVLVPAGRGIYAHTIVAVDNDIGGQIVLQADSGPIAGDRMLGTFSKAGGHENLLVVTVTSIVHHGDQIPTNGVVIAPQTMQTAVASSVDQHYLSRFLLPAAAAFVQGLGSALATTSNTVGQLGPLGNTSYVTSLNFPQQVGVGAGAAAQRVGAALDQAAPTGPTIHLDANANVGVIFTSDVKSKTGAD